MYLSCRDMLPAAEHPRADAFEHTRMMAALGPAFADRGVTLIDLAWDDPQVLEADAALIGTAWDYWGRAPEFLARLTQIEARMPLFNGSQIVRWNSDKRYLAELQRRGAPSIPTLWVEPGADLARCFSELSTSCIVAKRVVGAGAHGQHRLRVGERMPEVTHPTLVQSYLPSIETHGEVSVVVIDGVICHSLVKRAAAGDYRIQSIYGGWEAPHAPTATEVRAVTEVLGLIDEVPLYARVDLVELAGRPVLMELELIEPYLYPMQGPALGDRLADALLSRL